VQDNPTLFGRQTTELVGGTLIRKLTNVLQEFSLPLIFGVIAGLIFANVDNHAYHAIVHYPVLGKGAAIFGHKIDFHFIVNDIFMVFFFGIAAKEITESVLPGGPLNPIRKAINPLFGTLGGVVGPVGVYFLLTFVLFSGTKHFSAVANGWGIPTATDIALAWLVARLVFGSRHPAVNYLLLLAVADDALGLGIIAVFYPNPAHPVHIEWLLLTLAGMGVAFGFRKFKVNTWFPYIFIAGVISWLGLLKASLHPALAFVFVVPFIPAGDHDHGLFVEEDIEDMPPATEEQKMNARELKRTTMNLPIVVPHHSPLEQFEHQLKLFVDLGLFFFAFANAGVPFSNINTVTWIVLASLLLGKTIGITFFSWLAEKLGFPLPQGMGFKHLIVAGIVAGLGLTVALFVSGQAFPGKSIFQGPAKMGAVFSALAALIAFLVGRALKVKDGAGQ
jgi:NhaA family Na+:H+ antiporter